MRKKRKSKKTLFPKIFKPPKSKYFLITFKTILFLLSLAAITGLFFWLFSGDFFKIKTIDCLKQEFGCSSEENSFLEPLYGQNIFLLQSKTRSQSILKNNPEILKVKIIKKLPNSLKIILTLRKPIAIVKTEKERLLTDQSGFVFDVAKEDKEKLPVIILSFAIAIGEKLEGNLEKQAIFLVKKLNESFIGFEEIKIKDRGFLEVSSSGKMIATFSGEKALAPQVDSLQYILHHSKIETEIIKIDLRFDKPIFVK